MLLAPRADRIGFVATVALVPMLLTMVVGSIGEAASPYRRTFPIRSSYGAAFFALVALMRLQRTSSVRTFTGSGLLVVP